MQLPVSQAIDLAVRVLARHGVPERYARMTAEHLVDSARCGHEFSSLPRLLAIVEALRGRPPAGEIRVVREDERSALIDGADNLGYAVSLVALDKAIELARKSGIAVVGANNTWFSGRLSYYAERAAREGFVALHTTNTTARVAPFGGIDRLFGTNALAIAFPARDGPLVIDFTTAAITWGEVVLHEEKGEPLPPGVAVDAQGRATTDPRAALEGAFLNWGGARGYGLCLAIQALGVLAGSHLVVRETGGFGLFFLVLDPRLLAPQADYPERIAELKELVRASRPAPGAPPVRIPGERSQRNRAASLAAGTIYVDDRIYQRLRALCG